MVFDVPLFLLALVLLLFPRQWMRTGITFRARRRRHAAGRVFVEPWKTREHGDPRVSFEREFTRFRNYLDLLRAGLGGLLLLGGLGLTPCVRLATDAPVNTATQLLTLRMGLLLGGLVVQTIRLEHRRVAFYPPIFYLAGLSLALCGWKTAVFAFALVWAVNAALGNAQAFLAVYALLLLGFGALFAGIRNPWTGFASLLAFIPVLLSLLTNRPLHLLSPRGRHVARG